MIRERQSSDIGATVILLAYLRTDLLKQCVTLLRQLAVLHFA